jgi:hypothetical protein
MGAERVPVRGSVKRPLARMEKLQPDRGRVSELVQLLIRRQCDNDI